MSRAQIGLQLLVSSSLLTFVWTLPLQVQISDNDGWIPYERGDDLHYFKLFNKDSDFFEAERNCLRHYGHLASFQDADEYDFIRDIFGDQDQLWLGLFNYGEKSSTNLYDFWFTDGHTFDPSSWRGAYPMIFVNQNERGYGLPSHLAVQGGHRSLFCSALAADHPNLWVIGVECDERREAHICKISADGYIEASMTTTTTTMTPSTTTTTTTMPSTTTTTTTTTTPSTTTTTTTTTPETTTAAATMTTETVSSTTVPPQAFPILFNAWAAPAGPPAPEITAITVAPHDECVGFQLSDLANWNARLLARCGWRDPIFALALAAVALALVLTLCCWRCCCWLADRRHSADYRLAKAELARRRRPDAVYASFKHAAQPGDFYDDGDTTITDFV